MLGSVLYMAAISRSKRVLHCGRLSLKVGVSMLFSTLKGSGCRWMAATYARTHAEGGTKQRLAVHHAAGTQEQA